MGDYDHPQSEDCLTLSIWTPAADGRRRAVLVWLPGGEWITGAGSLDWYNGSLLAREGDIVVVSPNYRLGAFGYLCRPGICDGNLGTLDQIQALLWIQDNIAAFGGDPWRITVAGQSASAFSIATILAAKAENKLFQRAILHSGPFGRPPVSVEEAQVSGNKFLALLNIDGDSADAITRLRRVPVERILDAQAKIIESRPAKPPFSPIISRPTTQSKFLSDIADGAKGMDVIIGVTREESHAFAYATDSTLSKLSEVDILNKVIGLAGRKDAIDIYRTRRPLGTAIDIFSDWQTDRTFVWPAMQLAEKISAKRGKVYCFQFNWSPPASRLKACHSIETPFLFGNFDAWSGAAMLEGAQLLEMQAISSVMRKAWLGFIQDGNPSLAGRYWPSYEYAKRRTLILDTLIGVAGDAAEIEWRIPQT
jgi:para-nitrobenzyl esterase